MPAIQVRGVVLLDCATPKKIIYLYVKSYEINDYLVESNHFSVDLEVAIS
jgi:hypothetical protein